ISDKIEVSVNQVEFSLTQHEAMHNGVLDQMMQKNIHAMSWSPLGSYFKEVNDRTYRITKALDTLTEKYNQTEDALLLSWILKHPANISPVIGTTNKDRILNANKALEIQLDLEDWFMLLVESQGQPVP